MSVLGISKKYRFRCIMKPNGLVVSHLCRPLSGCNFENTVIDDRRTIETVSTVKNMHTRELEGNFYMAKTLGYVGLRLKS
jgi:hypothetical protein